MKRREVLLTGLAATVLATALDAHGQTTKEPRRVTVLSPVVNPVFDEFRKALRELGYVEGRDIRLDFRTADGNVDRLPALAEELVREGTVDAIIAESTPAATAARRATKTIPIVAYIAVDPVAAGLAASLAHPGGNVTGIAFLAEEQNAKRIELLHEVFPQVQHIGAIAARTSTPANSPGNFRAIQDAARKLSLAVEFITIDDPSELGHVLRPAALTAFDGFVFVPDVVFTIHTAEIVALIAASRKPAIYSNRTFAQAGGLMSFGQDIPDSYRHLASQLDRVLKGASPNDIPFERPTKFELVINLKTAKTLGLTVPPSLLARADEVIE
jgi:putative ABC transport system substrate-binding protein